MTLITHHLPPHTSLLRLHPGQLACGRDVPPTGPHGSSGPAPVSSYRVAQDSIRLSALGARAQGFREASPGTVFLDVPCSHFPEVPLPLWRSGQVKEQKPPLFSEPINFREVSAIS